MPQVPYVQADWVSAGYTIRPYTSCATAENDLKTLAVTWTTPTLLRVTGCRLDVNSATITVANHLAIVSDWGIRFLNKTTWVAGGTALGANVVREIHLITPYGVTCSSSQGNIELNNQFTLPVPLRTFLYTPCTATLANNGQMQGQFYGGNLGFSNSTWIADRPVSGVPGYSPTSTTTYVRQVQVQYRREVTAG
jgi:hypothetical protein